MSHVRAAVALCLPAATPRLQLYFYYLVCFPYMRKSSCLT